MIVLDTNVVNEPLKPVPAQAVLNWLDRQASETLYLTAVSLAELLAGIEGLPQGHSRLELNQAFTRQILPLFEERMLSFDAKAAEAFGKIRAGAQALLVTRSVLPMPLLQRLRVRKVSHWQREMFAISGAPVLN